MTGRARTAVAAPGVAGGVLVGALVLGVLLAAIWPGLAVLFLALCAIAWLTVRDPRQAIWVALALFCFEGLAKISLAAWGSPVDDPRALGALLIDIGLVMPIVAILAADRGRSPLAVWERCRSWERLAFAAILIWLAISVIQIFVADPADGLAGFRVTQAYLILIPVGIVLFRGDQPPVRELLFLGALVCGYAFVRVITGSLEAEEVFVFIRDPAAFFDDVFRPIGSFQSSVGLASFITPMLAFTAVLAMRPGRYRRIAAAVALLAGVVLFASFVRVALVAVVFALPLGLLLLRSRDGLRSYARSAAIALAVLLAVVGLAALASRGSPIAEERFEGLFDPGDDLSLDIRFNTWGDAIDDFASSPLGQGLGTVGRVTQDEDGPDITDNSFLKVLVEQGIPGAIPYLLGLLGVAIACGMRLRRLAPGDRDFGVAALCGFAAFMILGIAGEYVEQPGKVLGWMLLGAAVGQGYLRDLDPPPRAAARAAAGAAPGRRGRIAATAIVAAVAVAMTVFTASREQRYDGSVEAFPVRVGPYPAPVELSYWDALTHNPSLRIGTLYERPLTSSSDLIEQVRLVPTETAPGTFRIVAPGATPENATQLAREFGEQLAYFSARQVGRVAQRQTELLSSRLPDASTAERRRILDALAERHPYLENDPSPPGAERMALAPLDPPAEISGWADEVVDELPGAFSPAPGLVWSIIAGVGATGLCWLLWPAAVSRRGSERAAAPEPRSR